MPEYRSLLGHERCKLNAPLSQVRRWLLISANDTQGGGSTFGVITSMTMMTFPSPQVLNNNFYFFTTSTTAGAFDAVTYFVSKLPELAAAGVSGYPLIYDNVRNPVITTRNNLTGIAGKLVMFDTKDPAEFKKILDPIVKHINATWPGFVFSQNTTSYPNYLSWYSEHYDSSAAGHGSIMASRLLDAKALAGNTTALGTAYKKFQGSDLTSLFIVSGKGVWEAKPRGGGNAVSPAWRTAIVHSSEFHPC
jgi:hypothetical protein